MAGIRGKKQAWAVGLLVLALGFVVAPILYREFKLRRSLTNMLELMGGSEVTPPAEWLDDFRDFAERSGRHRTIQLLKGYAEDHAGWRRIAVLALSSLLPSEEYQKYAQDVLSEEDFRWFNKVVAWYGLTVVSVRPYRWEGLWAFDDDRLGLEKEPFVEGADAIIEKILAMKSIPEAGKGFRLLFSAGPLPNYDLKFEWLREDAGGNRYQAEDFEVQGWLCPALLEYFYGPPREIYVRFDARPP